MCWKRALEISGALMFAVMTLAGAQAQEVTQADSGATPVIRTETRVVLVDAVVTDKKGEYLRDLKRDDFRIWEDNSEQEITSFSLESDAAKTKKQIQYMVLFFDNTTMSNGDQMQAHAAAGKFIDSNWSPDHVMAVVNYGGMMQIAQNFTGDKEKLKRAVSGVKMASVHANDDTIDIASGGVPSIGGAEMDFAARSGLLALRSMVKTIAGLPGRKTLVLLTSGFAVTPEQMPEVTAVINDCNRANVAIYPIDVRGLVAQNEFPFAYPVFETGRPEGGAFIQRVAYAPRATPAQHSGGGGTGGGGGSTGGGGSRGGGGNTGGGNPGGSRSPSPTSPGTGGKTAPGTGGKTAPGTGGGSRVGGGGGSGVNFNNNNYNRINNPFNRAALIPPLLSNVSTNQQVLYMLANGTGGFVILNTNDLVSGLQKIARDGNEYYLLGYRPPDSEEGKCHTLKVKVNRGGTIVRARTGYCNVPPQDLLSGNSIEKELEKRAAGPASGTGSGSMQAPFFYTAPNRARVNFAMDMPSESIKPAKVKKKLHAEVNILGIAYGPDGKAAARFSDTMKFDWDDKKQFEEFQQHPVHYENQFSIAPGKYTLDLVFEMGRNFGKLELPLAVDPWDGKHFSISGLAFSTSVQRVSDAGSAIDAELLADRTPLITQGMEVAPAGSTHLRKSGIGILYAEVYEPLMTSATPPKMGLQLRVVDRKTGQSKFDTGLFAPTPTDTAQSKNPTVPVGMKLPLDTLPPGSYRAELTARDSAGGVVTRTSEFEVE